MVLLGLVQRQARDLSQSQDPEEAWLKICEREIGEARLIVGLISERASELAMAAWLDLV